MSLYNLMYGVQAETFFILPMLGKHPDEYPRFRDCFMGSMSKGEPDQFGIPTRKHGKEELISIYTRVGGGNREDYKKEIDELRAMLGFIRDYDDDFDSTFATFEFQIPEQFMKDFIKIKEGKIREISNEYKELMYKIYPKLKDKFDKIFA